MTEQMSLLEQEKFARANRRLAEEKIREEIRNAVKLQVMKRDDLGLDRTTIANGVRELMDTLVKENVRRAIRDQEIEIQKQLGDADALVRRVVVEEIRAALGAGKDKNALRDMLKEMIKDEVRKYAASFVEKNVTLNIVEGEGSW